MNPRRHGAAALAVTSARTSARTFALSAALSATLVGCASLTPPPAPTAPAAMTPPARWLTDLPPMPHGGRVGQLSAWWKQWNDPLLSELVDAGQQASPSLAAAQSRLVQARATRVAAGAANQPRVDGSVSATRSNTNLLLPTNTVVQAGLQASWELDLFGAGRAGREAADARLAAADASWHEARVSVAAETASAYLGWRNCERQRALAVRDAASRSETARLVQASASAGFTAPATAALARASAAEAAARLRQQQAQCDSQQQALAAMTAQSPDALRARLTRQAEPVPADPVAAMTALARAPLFAVSAVPAQVLAQRPDLFQAERAVAAARADIGAAQADRYPRLTLGGTVAAGAVRMSGGETTGQTWSLGPLNLTLPLFDAGRRAANVEAAQARYEEAVSRYQAQTRRAVQEVEQSLLALEAARGRSGDASAAAEGYRASFEATETRHRNGLASLVELEDARRNLLAAETALVQLQREMQEGWIALYQAAGGGWEAASAAPARTAPLPSPASASAPSKP